MFQTYELFPEGCMHSCARALALQNFSINFHCNFGCFPFVFCRLISVRYFCSPSFSVFFVTLTLLLQARAVLTFLDAVSEKKLRSTVALTAARGRGKSAALGLCLAGAIAYGYANIFVTAPSPENLRTVFEFLLKGERLPNVVHERASFCYCKQVCSMQFFL